MGGLEPVQLSIPQLPMWESNTLSGPVCKSLLLQVDLSWEMLGDKISLIPGTCKASTLPCSPHLAVQWPRKLANHTGMAAELQELLSRCWTPPAQPRDSTPRRPISVAWVAPLTIRVEDPLRLDRPVSATPEPVATSQQASPQAARPDEAIPISHSPSPSLASETLEATSVPATLQPGTHPGTNPSALSDEVLWLQEEMNRVMGCLLTSRTSIDALCRKQVSDFKTTFCQNKAQTAKAITEMWSVVWLQFKLLRLCVQQLSGRQRPPVQSVPTSYNNHMRNVCRKWRGKPLRRKGGITSLF